LRLLARSTEPSVEGTIGRVYVQAVPEDHQRIDHRVEDRFRVFPLVDGLTETCAESGDIREREHRAANLAVGSSVRGDANKKPSVAIA